MVQSLCWWKKRILKKKMFISRKIPLIYWMTLIYIIRSFSVKKTFLLVIEWPSYIIRSFSVKRNSPYLLNDPHLYNRLLLSQNKLEEFILMTLIQKKFALFIEWLSYIWRWISKSAAWDSYFLNFVLKFLLYNIPSMWLIFLTGIKCIDK